MDLKEAKRLVDEYGHRSYLTPEEEFTLIEAFRYLIEETKQTRYMTELGGYYYDKKDFDLALKYYEMADAYGDPWAPEGLGYIWYYGRTGEKDYEKAFHYYVRAAKNGYARSMVKVADMYKNGYYVAKNYDMYCQTIEAAFEQMLDGYNLFDPMPEVYMRLARIREEQERPEEAIILYEQARDVLAERLLYNSFFGDLNQIKWATEDLDRLRREYPDVWDQEHDGHADEYDLYDLYILLRKPCTVTFTCDGDAYEAEAVAEEDGSVSVRFLGKWYRTPDDFLSNALIGGEKLSALFDSIGGIEVK